MSESYWNVEAERYAAACEVPAWNWHKLNGASYQFFYRDENRSVCVWKNELSVGIRLSIHGGGFIYFFDEPDGLYILALSQEIDLQPLFDCAKRLGYGDDLFLLALEHGCTV